MPEANSQNQNSNQKNLDDKTQNQNVNQTKPAPVEYENVEVYIVSMKKTYKYYMTNDWNLLLKKLDSLGFKAPVPLNWRWNPNLGKEVRAKMAELGVIYSVTLDNGANVLNCYRNGSNVPYIVFLNELKPSPAVANQLILLRKNKEDFSAALQKDFDNLSEKSERLPGKNEWPLIMVAAEAGSVESVKYLISQGADVNYHDNHGISPLLLAVVRKNLEIIKLLLDAGADANYLLRSNTRMFIFATASDAEMLEMFKNAGADFNKLRVASKNPDGHLSFNDTLEFFIEEFRLRKNKVSQIYKNTQINGSGGLSKQTFSKIRNNKDSKFHPEKENVFLLAIGMGLNLEETETLLSSAGYVFDEKSEVDMIVKEFIKKRNYNIEDIENELFEKTGKCLGNWGDDDN